MMVNRFVDPSLGYLLSGTLTFTHGSNVVTGVGTRFTEEITVNRYCYIRLVNAPLPIWYKVTSVANDTSLLASGGLLRYGQETVTGPAWINYNDGSTPELAMASFLPNFAPRYGVKDPGSTIYLRRGQIYHGYQSDQVSIDGGGSGELGNPITMMGDNGIGWPGETGLPKPVFVHVSPIHMTGKGYWTFREFEYVDHYEALGSFRVDRCWNIIFDGVDFHDNILAGQGLIVDGCLNVLLRNCALYNNQGYNSHLHGTSLIISKQWGPSTVFIDGCSFDAGPDVPSPGSPMPGPSGIAAGYSTLYLRDTTFGLTYPFTLDIGGGGVAYVDNVTFTTGVEGIELIEQAWTYPAGPPPVHRLTLLARMDPEQTPLSISFNLDHGIYVQTPYDADHLEGHYTIYMPPTYATLSFRMWLPDGDTNPTKTILLDRATSLLATYSRDVTPTTHRTTVQAMCNNTLIQIPVLVDSVEAVTPVTKDLSEGQHTLNSPEEIDV